MRRKLLLILLCFFIFLGQGCGPALDAILLQPQAIPLTQKLDIQLKNSYDINFKGKSSDLNSDIRELLNDEINTNYINNNQFSKGYLVPRIDCDIKEAGHGFAFLTGFTLGTLNLLGMPIAGRRIDVRARFTIEDGDNNIIWKRSYHDSHISYYGYWYGWGSAKANNTLHLLRKILLDLKEDISNDITIITEDLSKSKLAPPKNRQTVSAEWRENGSGFFISESGYIVTNNHVIDGWNQFQVEFKYNNEIRSFNTKVIKVDPINDLAIIKIDDSEFSNKEDIPYNFKRKNVDIGTDIFAMGYPLTGIMGKDIKSTFGKISSKTGLGGDPTKYQIQVPIQPGNSGGPLFDYKGNLIGITSSGINRKLDLTENVNYAIKSNYLLNLIDVLPETITLPLSTQLASKELTEQIKILSDYVVLIKVK